jgi:hypothetical protein
MHSETVSFVYGLMRGAESECCPSVPVVNPAPAMTPTAPMVNESSGGRIVNVLVIAISSFMALAIFYVRKMASNVIGTDARRSYSHSFGTDKRPRDR